MREAKELKVRKSKTVEVSSRGLLTASLAYLLLPVIVFFTAYLKLYIGIPASLIMIACFVIVAGRGRVSEKFFSRIGIKPSSGKTISLPLGFVMLLAVAAVILAVTSGIGEFVYSTEDHSFRRAIFRDMIDYKWPVFFDSSTQSNPAIRAYMGEGKAAFVYYMTYWMVPALVGKAFGFAAGNVALVLWSASGIFLVLLGMNMFIGKRSFATLFTFIYACGLDAVPFWIHKMHGMPDWGWLEGWTHHLSYLGMSTNLLNVYNQVIPCWIAVILLMTATDTVAIGFIGALTFAYSPWVTIGILPIALARLLARREDRKIKAIVNPLNIIPPVLILIVFGTYYAAGSGKAMEKGFTWEFYGSVPKFLGAYLLLIVIEILPYLLITRKEDRKEPVLIASVITLLVIPFYMVSLNNDLCMRASMPALFVLTVYMTLCIASVDYDKIREGHITVKHIGAAVLLGVMAYIGMYYFQVGAGLTLAGEHPRDDIGSLGDIDDTIYVGVVIDQFYSYDYDDSLFFEYLSRDGG